MGAAASPPAAAAVPHDFKQLARCFSRDYLGLATAAQPIVPSADDDEPPPTTCSLAELLLQLGRALRMERVWMRVVVVSVQMTAARVAA